MPDYKAWRCRCRSKRTGDIEYICVGGAGLQSSDDVALHIAGWAHLEFLDCQPYHSAILRDTEGKVLSARPIDPDHFMAGSLAELKKDVQKYLQSIGRWAGRTTRPSDLFRAAAEVSKAAPKEQTAPARAAAQGQPHMPEPQRPPDEPRRFRSRFVQIYTR